MSASDGSAEVTLADDDPIGEVARHLIHRLCAELSARYGAPPSPFSPAEAAGPRSVFLVARMGGTPVACGALRPIDDTVAEVKRMYVAPEGRRRGLARRILNELEHRAIGFGYRTVRLETGVGQPEAVALYEACGYRRIPAYGPFVGNPTSICFEKFLNQQGAGRHGKR